MWSSTNLVGIACLTGFVGFCLGSRMFSSNNNYHVSKKDDNIVISDSNGSIVTISADGRSIIANNGACVSSSVPSASVIARNGSVVSTGNASVRSFSFWPFF